MDHPLNPEGRRKQSISLRRAYLLVGVVGVVMLVFIVNNYMNAKRLNELTSPLWTAIREVELEATAVQHEATDRLRGEIDPAAETLWFYLDQSIWHLTNLLQSYGQHSRSWLFSEKLDVSGRMATIHEHLVQLKGFFKVHQGQSRTPEAVTETIMQFNERFAAFRFQLEAVEADISREMVKEQLQQRISYALLVVFCLAMVALVAYQIRRYEGYRDESYRTLHVANSQLARQIAERQRVEEKLESAYRELENRVTERTLALSDMNQALQAEIEERRQIENHLRKNRNTLQTVIDGISDSLMLVDKDMHIRMLNRVAAKTYQIDSPDNVIGKLCSHEIGQLDSCADCPIPCVVQRGESLTFERQGVTDAERLERITIYPVTQAEDASGGAIIRICDITEEKRFERQLVQSEKMASLGILVSSIGHEINNPNNFITFNIPILRDYLDALVQISDQYADAQSDFELFHMSYDEFRTDVFKLVDNIEHGAGRISNFVANLREFSQGNGNREKVQLELPAVIDKVLSICRSQIKKRIRDFKIDIPANQPTVYADEYSLEQVLLNLIVNAVQAADKADAALTVSAATGASWRDAIIITVADNGCGIDEKHLGKIFNPFYTTKSAAEGTGLGLYVCHNLVQRLGGRIEVQSRKGEGSTFSIFLPDKDRRAQTRS